MKNSWSDKKRLVRVRNFLETNLLDIFPTLHGNHESEMYIYMLLAYINFLFETYWNFCTMWCLRGENRRSGRRSRRKTGVWNASQTFALLYVANVTPVWKRYTCLGSYTISHPSRFSYLSKRTAVLFCNLHLFDPEGVIRIDALEDKC